MTTPLHPFAAFVLAVVWMACWVAAFWWGIWAVGHVRVERGVEWAWLTRMAVWVVCCMVLGPWMVATYFSARILLMLFECVFPMRDWDGDGV